MPHGYNGKILHIHLDRLELEVETPPEAFYRTYAGGSALGTYYLLKHSPAGVDALGPENTLTLSLSVLTGAPVSGQSRITATAKSPLTDAIGDAQAGGFFPAEMKFAGFDAFVIHGQAEKPVYLWVKDGKAELRPAWHLYSPDQMVDTIRAITGWDVDINEVLTVRQRRLNLMRAFNVREGFGREEDKLPKKISKALVGGPSDGLFVTEGAIEQAKDWYYAEAGWDVASGAPTAETLEALDLGWVAELLAA